MLYCCPLAHASVAAYNILWNTVKSFSRQTQHVWLLVHFAQEAINTLKGEKRFFLLDLVFDGVCSLSCSDLGLFKELAFIYLLFSIGPMDIRIRDVYVLRRITEWLMAEGTHDGHLVQPLLLQQGHLQSVAEDCV